MRILVGIVFWTLAALEGLWLLFMLFVSLAAGPRMAENGDMWSPIFTNILLPLVVLTGAILLFALTRSLATRGIALSVVLAPILWFLTLPTYVYDGPTGSPPPNAGATMPENTPD